MAAATAGPGPGTEKSAPDRLARRPPRDVPRDRSGGRLALVLDLRPELRQADRHARREGRRRLVRGREGRVLGRIRRPRARGSRPTGSGSTSRRTARRPEPRPATSTSGWSSGRAVDGARPLLVPAPVSLPRAETCTMWRCRRDDLLSSYRAGGAGRADIWRVPSKGEPTNLGAHRLTVRGRDRSLRESRREVDDPRRHRPPGAWAATISL